MSRDDFEDFSGVERRKTSSRAPTEKEAGGPVANQKTLGTSRQIVSLTPWLFGKTRIERQIVLQVHRAFRVPVEPEVNNHRYRRDGVGRRATRPIA